MIVVMLKDNSMHIPSVNAEVAINVKSADMSGKLVCNVVNKSVVGSPSREIPMETINDIIVDGVKMDFARGGDDGEY